MVPCFSSVHRSPIAHGESVDRVAPQFIAEQSGWCLLGDQPDHSIPRIELVRYQIIIHGTQLLDHLHHSLNHLCLVICHCRPPSGIDLSSPLGHLANEIYIQRLPGLIYFWNRRNARLLLAIREDRATRFDRDLDNSLKVTNCRLETVFNDLLDISSPNPRCTGPVFQEFASLLLSIAGVGVPPTGLLNLNGLIVYKRDLPPTVRLNQLFAIGSLPILLRAIGETSVILDLYAVTNNQFIFHDSTSSIITQSGLPIGTLIGDKRISTRITAAVDALLATLKPNELRLLDSYLLSANAVSGPVKDAVDILFRSQPGNWID